MAEEEQTVSILVKEAEGLLELRYLINRQAIHSTASKANRREEEEARKKDVV